MSLNNIIEDRSHEKLLDRLSTGYFPFDAVDFYENNRELVWKYLTKNTRNYLIPDITPDDKDIQERNPSLLRAYKPQTLDIPHKVEWIKCSVDIIYFIEKYIKVRHPDKGIVPFKLFPFQRDMMDVYINERFSVMMTARQMGKTTTSGSFINHFSIFEKEKEVAVVAQRQDQAVEILDRVKAGLEDLPFFLKVGVLLYNRKTVKLDNGSTIGAYSSNSNGLRGKSISLAFIDEAAFIPKDMEFYASTFPIITGGQESKVIITSTPNGKRGMFYEIWENSNPEIKEQSGSPYVRRMFDWSHHPDRDEKFKKETIGAIGEARWDREYCCLFSGAEGSLLPTYVQAKLQHQAPIDEDDDFRKYAEPVPGHKYFSTVDSARGLGQDSSVINVFDVTTIPYRQVYTYQSSDISPLLFAGVIATVGREYNDADTLIELNDIGESVAYDLYENYDYENVVRTYKDGNKQVLGFGKNSRIGMKTTVTTKAVGCSSVVTLLDKDKIILNDASTIDEFGTFIAKGRSYEAAPNTHDDLVMTCVIFAWATTQQYFIDTYENNVQGSIREETKGIDYMQPIYDDGINTYGASLDAVYFDDMTRSMIM